MKILVFPKATNPYQDLLYKEMYKFSGFSYEYISFYFSKSTIVNCMVFPMMLVLKRLQKFNILHIHWLYEFSGVRGNTPFLKVFFTFYVLWVLHFIRMIGFKLIYTIHDIETHDKLFLFNKRVISSILHKSSHVIVLSKSTLQMMESMSVPVSKTKITVIPHGNYIGQYENTMTQKQARHALQIHRNQFVLLFFGIIRAYKGVSELLQVLREMDQKNNIVIIVAGMCYDEHVKHTIIEFSKDYPSHIRVVLKHIPDSEVQVYFNACDCAVLPFTNITNSGSAVLASSFKKPFIAPLLGSIRDFPRDSGIFYSPTQADGLRQAIETARLSKTLSQKGSAGYEYVTKLSWSMVAKKTMNLFKAIQ